MQYRHFTLDGPASIASKYTLGINNILERKHVTRLVILLGIISCIIGNTGIFSIIIRYFVVGFKATIVKNSKVFISATIIYQFVVRSKIVFINFLSLVFQSILEISKEKIVNTFINKNFKKILTKQLFYSE